MQSLNEDTHTATATTIEIIDNGDLFNSGMQTLVNPINCRGVMGKGLASLFKEHYPAMFKDYKNRCQKGLVKLGEPYLWKETPTSDVCIINFPTKDHWRQSSDLNDIQNGLRYLAEHAHTWGITSLAIPALGCGLGGLALDDVLPELNAQLHHLNIPIKIYKDGPKLDHTSKKRKPNTQTTLDSLLIQDSLFSTKRRHIKRLSSLETHESDIDPSSKTEPPTQKP